MKMSDPFIEVVNVNKVYDNGVHALKDVSIKVYEKDFLAIIGLSGSGKSTLLRCLNGLIPVTSGEIFYRGKKISHLQGLPLRQQRKKMGMIFQHFNLIPRKSVLQNVLSGSLGDSQLMPSLLGRYPQDKMDQAITYLDLVGLKDRASHRADHLSGGQQQRVAIARALMQQPEVILGDEPVASLDPATSYSIMDHLDRVNKEMNKTILCNLHFLSLVRRYASRAIALKDGKVVFDGSPDHISKEWFYKIYGEQAREVSIE